MGKLETFIMRAARANSKMDNNLYKQMMKQKDLLKGKITLRDFKEAFHSPETPPTYRAMLLIRLFNKEVNYTKMIKTFSKSKKARSSGGFILRVVGGARGGKSLGVFSHNKQSATYEEYNIPSKVKAEIANWIPPANKDRLLSKALNSGNAAKQKAATLISEVGSAVKAVADMLLTNVDANDPFKLYVSTSDRNYTEENIQNISTEDGHYKDTQVKFLRDLQHMQGQLKGFYPVLNKLGIDTSKFEGGLNNLLDETVRFTSTEHSSHLDEISDMYGIHGQIKEAASSLYEISIQIDNLDIDSPEIYKLGRLDNVPKFVDYNPSKNERHRYISGENISARVEDLIKKVFKK